MYEYFCEKFFNTNLLAIFAFCPNKMKEFWILILVAFVVTDSLDKAESVQLQELPLQTFDELFVEEWLNKDEAEDLKTPAPANFGQNVNNQIDRQNTQLGQIEPNSTDQNPPLTETNSDNVKNAKEDAEDERKHKIVAKFHAKKDEFMQKGKYSAKEWVQIEKEIAKHLKVNRTKIYEWKKEFGLSRINQQNERKDLVEKFDKRKAELKRAGMKNSYPNQIDKTVAKELGLSYITFYRWKSELRQTAPKHTHSHSEQKELMKHYYEIKDQNPLISDAKIAKMLKIGSATLTRWKKQFKRQQFQPNSVDGHSVEENAGSNVQEIENSNSESF